MRFTSANATGADLEATCRQLAAALQSSLGPGPIDLVVLFATTRYGVGIERAPALLQDLLGARELIGCSGAGLVDGAERLEGRHALVALAGRLPGVELRTAMLSDADLPDADAPPSHWHRLLQAGRDELRGLVVLSEPFHCDVKALLAGLDYAWPNLPKVGGIASGSRHPDGNVLFYGRNAHRSGALVLGLAGEVELLPVVAQGCRAVGRPGRITRADHNRLIEIDAATAVRFVEQQLGELEAADLTLAEQNPLFLGIGSDAFANRAPAPGEYLVRNILGIDPDTGHLLLGDRPSVGRHVQLHLRDAASSEQDLRLQLRRTAPQTAQAALMFRCLGRSGDDQALFCRESGGVPLVGFLCNGEIGPVGGVTHLHGYTTTMALLRRRQPGQPT